MLLYLCVCVRERDGDGYRERHSEGGWRGRKIPTGRGHTLTSLPQTSARRTIVDDERSVIATAF